MTFDVDDPIAALASAPGPAARGILRISGEGSREAVAEVFVADDEQRWASARIAARHPGRLRLSGLGISLPAAAYLWPTVRSYTGQPLVELHLPGSPPLLEAALAALYRNGVRPARPGEFTLRAFLAGRLDLVQAEAVLGVIDAADHRELDVALRQLAGGISGRLTDLRSDLLSLLADLEAGLDFVDEDIEFVSRSEVVRRLSEARDALDVLLADVSDRWRDGDRLRVVLAGLPNAGKSTLFNALVGSDRAIVSSTAGTTRDWLTAEIELAGRTIDLIDTAGWEHAGDDLSTAMQSLRAEQLDRADLILWCTAADASIEYRELALRLRQPFEVKTIEVLTKRDLLPHEASSRREPTVSAVTGEGLDELRDLLGEELALPRSASRQMIGSTAARGRESLASARDALTAALTAAGEDLGDEILSAELRLALSGLAAVLGVVYTDDVLDVIFSRFCIGK